MSLSDQLRTAVVGALERHGFFSNEDGRACDEAKIDLQSALIEALGPQQCERELPATFGPAQVPPPDPPPEMGRSKDVCARHGRHRRLDILWRTADRIAAVEVKLRRITNWSGSYADGSMLYPRKVVDTYGYEVLKDIHRMERIRSVVSATGSVVPTDRFVLFLTNDPYEYEARVPHANLRLTHGRVLEPHHLAQFNLNRTNGQPTSPNTLWRDYPPFRLAGRHEIRWVELNDDVRRFAPTPPTVAAYPSSRLLLIPVQPQEDAS